VRTHVLVHIPCWSGFCRDTHVLLDISLGGLLRDAHVLLTSRFPRIVNVQSPCNFFYSPGLWVRSSPRVVATALENCFFRALPCMSSRRARGKSATAPLYQDPRVPHSTCVHPFPCGGQMKGQSTSGALRSVTECSLGRDSAYPVAHRKPCPRSFLTDVYLRLRHGRSTRIQKGQGSQRYVT